MNGATTNQIIERGCFQAGKRRWWTSFPAENAVIFFVTSSSANHDQVRHWRMKTLTFTSPWGLFAWVLGWCVRAGVRRWKQQPRAANGGLIDRVWWCSSGSSLAAWCDRVTTLAGSALEFSIVSLLRSYATRHFYTAWFLLEILLRVFFNFMYSVATCKIICKLVTDLSPLHQQ
jgi:hypothetical protein